MKRKQNITYIMSWGYIKEMKKIILLINGLLALSFQSCQNNIETINPYIVIEDPELGCKTLYYRTEELNFERIRCIEGAVQKKDYIFIKLPSGYQHINIKKDIASDLGNPLVKENISTILNENEFHHLLDSLKIEDLHF